MRSYFWAPGALGLQPWGLRPGRSRPVVAVAMAPLRAATLLLSASLALIFAGQATGAASQKPRRRRRGSHAESGARRPDLEAPPPPRANLAPRRATRGNGTRPCKRLCGSKSLSLRAADRGRAVGAAACRLKGYRTSERDGSHPEWPRERFKPTRRHGESGGSA